MTIDLTSKDVEDLKYIAYLGLLVMPRYITKLVELTGRDPSEMKTDELVMQFGILHGSISQLPQTFLDRFPVLEKLLMNKSLTRRVVKQLVEAKLCHVDSFDERMLKTMKAPFNKDDALRAAKEAVDELRTYVHEQHADGDSTIRIYVDGSCLGNPGPGGAGIVWCDGEESTEAAEPLEPMTTSGYAELKAVELALANLNDGEKLRPIKLYTDSQYVVNMLVKKFRPQVNRELVVRTRALVEELDIDVIKVPGHERIWANERADELARQAANEARAAVEDES